MTASNVRHRMLARIHIEFPKLRPDLRHDRDGMDEALHEFAAKACSLDGVGSLGELTDKELGWVLDAMNGKGPGAPTEALALKARDTVRTGKAEVDRGRRVLCGAFGRPKDGFEEYNVPRDLKTRPQPHNPDSDYQRIADFDSKLRASRQGSAEIVHLASEAQIATAAKLFENFVRWGTEKREEWLIKRFKGKRSVAMLTFKEANHLMRILFNIAVSRDIKRKTPGVEVSKAMIDAAIPDLKRRLGIK